MYAAANVATCDAATAAEPPHVMAARHSADAFRATHSANSFDGGHDHYAAAVAHHKAAKSQKAAGNDAGAAAHKKQAMFHMEQATAKAKAANEAAPEAIDWSAIPDPDAGLVATLAALFGTAATADAITAFISGVWANVLAVLNATEGLEDAAGMQEAGNTAADRNTVPARAARCAKAAAGVAAAVQALRSSLGAASAANTKAQADAANAQALQTQLTALTVQAANDRAARAELVVDNAIAKGKLVQGHRAGWLAQFKQDFDGTLRAVNSAPPFMKLVPRAEHLAQRAAIGSPGSARQNWLAAVNERMATDATILAYPAEQHWTMAYAIVRKQRPDLWEAMNKEGAPGAK